MEAKHKHTKLSGEDVDKDDFVTQQQPQHTSD